STAQQWWINEDTSTAQPQPRLRRRQRHFHSHWRALRSARHGFSAQPRNQPRHRRLRGRSERNRLQRRFRQLSVGGRISRILHAVFHTLVGASKPISGESSMFDSTSRVFARRKPIAACLATALCLAAPAAAIATPTTWTVNTCSEANTGSGTTGSLRFAAQNAVSGDTI